MAISLGILTQHFQTNPFWRTFLRPNPSIAVTEKDIYIIYKKTLIPTGWGKEDSVQLPKKRGFMVDITIVNRAYFMVYKPTNITGGPHPVASTKKSVPKVHLVVILPSWHRVPCSRGAPVRSLPATAQKLKFDEARDVGRLKCYGCTGHRAVHYSHYTCCKVPSSQHTSPIFPWEWNKKTPI